jgi:hypothetical protein
MEPPPPEVLATNQMNLPSEARRKLRFEAEIEQLRPASLSLHTFNSTRCKIPFSFNIFVRNDKSCRRKKIRERDSLIVLLKSTAHSRIYLFSCYVLLQDERNHIYIHLRAAIPREMNDLLPTLHQLYVRLERTNRKVKEENNRKKKNNRLTTETKRKRSSFFFQ